MQWASVVSQQTDLEANLEEIRDALQAQWGGGTADIAFVFVSPHFHGQYDVLPARLREVLPARFLVGCSGGGVVGNGRELERQPALSVTAGRLPGVQVHPFYTDTIELPDDDASPMEWKVRLGLEKIDEAQFIILADPFSTTAEAFLTGMDYAFPGSPKVGGLASGGQRPREQALFLGDQFYDEGLVGVALTGNVRMDTVVAQGCRPVGEELSVTRCEGNLLAEVDGMPPMQYLKSIAAVLNDKDRNLLRTSLFLGVEVPDFDRFNRDREFLIRNLIGVDYNSGALAAGAMLHEGQVVQFHLRDKLTSTEDLKRLLLSECPSVPEPTSEHGALLFSCLGRGEQLFGTPNHDAGLFREILGEMPLGGFFCNGEIGPIGRGTYVHGYTSAFGIFRPDEVAS